MHLMIPHASALDEAARHALGHLALPHLAALLQQLEPVAEWGDDEYSPDMPHELALAAAWNQPAPSIGAWLADDPTLAWALLSPVHLAVGSDGVDVLPPASLGLSPAEAVDCAELLRQLWPAAEGWQLRALDPTRWLLGHADQLDGLNAASLERVAGRPIEPWLPQDRRLRRWQNEAQMLLHEQPLNQARERRGEPIVNAVWLSGIGRAAGQRPQLTLDERLGPPLLGGDLAGWVQAFQALDAGPLAALRAAAERGEAVSLTLAGERKARRFEPRPRGLRDRLRGWLRPGPSLAARLESL